VEDTIGEQRFLLPCSAVEGESQAIMTADQVGERRGTFRPRVNWAFQRIRPRMREPLKIIKTPHWVNCQVAE